MTTLDLFAQTPEPEPVPSPEEDPAAQAARLLPPDEASRRIIRGEADANLPISEDPTIDLASNIVVRAGAGSGKTRSLVDRIVALVRAGNRIDGIAAITFTVKAAGELRQRFAASVQQQLTATEKRIAAERDTNRHQKWLDEADGLRDAVRHLDRVFIGTVHSFCGRLMGERPFQAGVAPDFSLLDPSRLKEHRRRFWSRFVARSAKDWMPRFAFLGIEPDDLFDLFCTTVDHEDVEFEGVTLRPPIPDLSDAVSAVEALVDEVLSRARAAVGQDSMLERFRELARFREVHGLATEALQAEFLALASHLPVKEGGTKGSVTLKHWGEKGTEARDCAAELVVRIPLLLEDVVGPALAEWRPFVFFDAGQFVRSAVREYAAERRSTGVQTFDDLLLGTKRLLQQSPENRAHFARRFTHILVDEFQDTDPVQAEILLLLASENREESDPWRCRPRPGTLFVVGDDKQSIYRFRRADVEVFRRFSDVLEESGGRTIGLTTNFRSDRRVCDFVNEAMRPVFAGERQAEWEDLVPHLETSASAHPYATMRIEVPSKTTKRSGPVVSAEVPQVALAVLDLVQHGALATQDGEVVELVGPLDYRDVMILVRTSNHMAQYAREFNRAGIPFSISGGKTLGKTESLGPLLDVLDAALKGDDVALLAFLRGPLCGVADDELMDFVEAGGRIGVGRDTDSATGALGAAFVQFGDLRDRLGTRAPADALESWLHTWGILPAFAVRDGGAEFAGSLLRIIALVRGWDAGGASWPEVVEELRRLRDGEIENEQLTLDALEGNAVQLLTAHQAKGLEAKVVFLVDPHWPDPPEPDLHVSRAGTVPGLAVRVGDKKSPVAWTPDWPQRLEEELAYQEAEELRLAYVAATRAEELLIVTHYARAEGPWNALYAGLPGVPAIASLGKPAQPQPAPPDLDVAETRAREQEERTRLLAEPTHAFKSPSGNDEAAFFRMEAEGRGKEYGLLVHRLFEFLVQGRVVDDAGVIATAQRIADEEMDLSKVQESVRQAVGDARALIESDLWQALADADEVLVETPYVFTHEDVTHTGIVDLAYLSGDVWRIVDYKTDPVSAEDLVMKHRSQLAAYREAWSRLVGPGDIRTSIWSTHAGRLVEVGV